MDLRQLTANAVEDAFGMWRYRWIALGIAWVIALVGWIWVLSLPNQYDATARVYVDTETTLRPLMEDLTVNKDTLTEVALVIQALVSGDAESFYAAGSGDVTARDVPATGRQPGRKNDGPARVKLQRSATGP